MSAVSGVGPAPTAFAVPSQQVARPVRDLGRRAGAGHTEAQVRCAPGSLLLLYTDGFTDVAGEDADERTDLLERTVAALPSGVSAEEATERVVAVCLPAELRDDVALLVVGLEG